MRKNGGKLAYFCEECVHEVTFEEKHESEINCSGHVFCRRCQEILRKRKYVEIKNKSD